MIMEEQLTAVEFMVEQLTAIGQLEIPKGSNAVTLIIEQAKAMEKHQIKNAYRTRYIKRFDSLNAEQYYNKTFKSK